MNRPTNRLIALALLAAALCLPAAHCATDARNALRTGLLNYLTASTVDALTALLPIDDMLAEKQPGDGG